MQGNWISDVMGWRYTIVRDGVVYRTAAYFKPWVPHVEENLHRAIQQHEAGKATELHNTGVREFKEYTLPAVL